MKLSERKKVVMWMNRKKQTVYDFLISEKNWQKGVGDLEGKLLLIILDHEIHFQRLQDEGGHDLYDNTLNVHIKGQDSFDECVRAYVEDEWKCDVYWVGATYSSRAGIIWTQMMWDEIMKDVV